LNRPAENIAYIEGKFKFITGDKDRKNAALGATKSIIHGPKSMIRDCFSITAEQRLCRVYDMTGRELKNHIEILFGHLKDKKYISSVYQVILI